MEEFSVTVHYIGSEDMNLGLLSDTKEGMSFGKTNYRTGGTRGGADQFKWDDVKNDKYRENYLGHSVHAAVGRWQKGKDLTWYAKASKEDRAIALQAEIAAAKQRDEDVMNEALGIAPRRRAAPTQQLDATEMKELLKRGASERDDLGADRIEGLGAAPVAGNGFETGPKKTLAQRYQDNLASGRADDTYALPGTVSANEAGGKMTERTAKKAAKAEKKLKKKLKKEHKKQKKEEKRKREDPDDARTSRSRHEESRRDSQRSRSRSPSVSRSRRHASRSRDRAIEDRFSSSRRTASSPSASPPRRHRGRSRSRSPSFERQRYRSRRSRSRSRR